MTAYERLLRSRLRSLLRAQASVSHMAWLTPVGDHEPYLEVSKVRVRALDRAADKARRALDPSTLLHFQTIAQEAK